MSKKYVGIFHYDLILYNLVLALVAIVEKCQCVIIACFEAMLHVTQAGLQTTHPTLVCSI